MPGVRVDLLISSSVTGRSCGLLMTVSGYEQLKLLDYDGDGNADEVGDYFLSELLRP